MDTLLIKPSISMRIIDLLITRIQDLTEDVSSLALEDVYNRVVRVLYKHADEVGEKLVTEKLTQQDIAVAVETGYSVVLTADHVNCDEMVDPVTGEPHTQHTQYPVPCMVIDRGARSLADYHRVFGELPGHGLRHDHIDIGLIHTTKQRGFFKGFD